MWINNCIGAINYRAFFIMIVSACIHLALYVTTLAALTSQETFQTFLAAFVVSWVSGAVNAVFVFLLLNLVVLHLYLLYKGISTYQFIVAQREAQKRKKEEEEQKKICSSQSHKVVYPAQMVSQQQNINSGEAIDDKHRTEKVQLHDEQSRSIEQNKIIQVESRSSVHAQEQMIFGERQVTEKSGMSKHDRPGEQEIDDSQSESSSVVLSQLFTRNKSLKLIIGSNQFYRPRKELAKNQHERIKKAHSMFK